MTRIYHLNCGWLQASPSVRACCHCLLLQDPGGLALVDTGIGLQDARRLPRQLVEAAGFLFDPVDSAARQLEQLGFSPAEVTDIVLTHCDCDHAGGLSDFPQARVHLASEELGALQSGSPRYVPAQFEHAPKWRTYSTSPDRWFGLEARPVALGFTSRVLLIPLVGHTLGHCGVAIEKEQGWLLHAGDAYYLREEIANSSHPVSALSQARAEDNQARLGGLEQISRLLRDPQVELFSYHDPSEWPPGSRPTGAVCSLG